MKKYDHKKIESKWQKFWAENKIFSAHDKSDAEKKFILIEFPYPSGTGLHMGHMRPFIAGDVVSKYWKLKGKNVMYPVGWDAFGLPAENFAIKNKVHPEVSTKKNIANAKKQLLSWGTGFDWDREINTTDPEYYRWTQWLFLQFLKKGLAYEATGLINWCPKDKTGLANEEVIDGKCERCGTVVEKKELRQWYLKITDYAEKLLEGLKALPEWPLAVKTQQENWIGRSEGAEFEFKLTAKNLQLGAIRVFTTRPDTLFGVTYVVLSPESNYVQSLKDKILNWSEIETYIEDTKNKTEIERTAEGKEKTGIELKGIKAVNPVHGEEVSVFVADYVLAHYGTGAVMAVPAHDGRDFEFAKKYNLPIKEVVSGGDSAKAFTADGELLNSGEYTGLKSDEARQKITEKFGQKKVTYKLRDWVFSRQRYWGEPIPIIHCRGCWEISNHKSQITNKKEGIDYVVVDGSEHMIVPVPEKDLPVKLPKVKEYEPTGTGDSPLAAIEKWVKVKCSECGGDARRETNTMPQWAGSSWYWLRYTDPKNTTNFSSQESQKVWTPVDIYFGGMEHTTLHLLYSRFWNLFLYDQGLVLEKEPFTKRVPHGMILGPDGEKMSKSRGNVVNPDDFVTDFGADTTRLYMMFLGPHENRVAWNSDAIIGTRRFLEKVWRIQEKVNEKKTVSESKELEILLHKTIKKVGEDIESFRFNTAISSLMILVNEIEKVEVISQETFGSILKLLSPFAPHMTDELWADLGNKESLYLESWPSYDESKLVSETVSIVVQIAGKVRAHVVVGRDVTEEVVLPLVKDLPEAKKWLDGKEIKRVVFVKNKLISFVL